MSGQREILFLCSRLPFPPNKGDKIRSHAILAYLTRHYRVHLACFAESESEMAHFAQARQAVNGELLVLPLPALSRYTRMAKAIFDGEPITASVFTSGSLWRWLSSLSRRCTLDGAVVFGSAMAPCLLDGSIVDPASVLFDMVDIDSDKWKQLARAARGPRRWIYNREAELLLTLEREAARSFGATLLISPFEAGDFAALAPDSRAKIKSLTNGVDWNYFSPQACPNPYPAGSLAVAMTGHMDYRPNVDAALWFAQEVLPLVRQKMPNIVFYAVGANPPSALRRRAREDFVVTGYVEDIRPYLQHAGAVVAPLRLARGLQNKVLEAMAMQKPVVATWEATRALAANPGAEILVANDATGFAASVVDAVAGPRRDQIAAAGQRFVRSRHDWNHITAEFGGHFDSLLRSTGVPHDGRTSAKPVSAAYAAR
ncbi:MAG TPA: TIGR03087 family PEP-CTERM/XrtA system glycosyltransferase [Rhizomicrobium sp.]|nr:TIGR03087 family PEP-CTERM/XrtA system glycosyltransferase [Rhizomicrobium sp.]